MINPETIQTIRPYVQRYGYYTVFFGVMLENIGIPVPGETILIIGGMLCGMELLHFPILIILTIIGAVLGDNLGYWIGRKGGRRLFEKYGHYAFIHQHHLEKVDHFFSKYGAMTIFFARFITGVRVIGAICAGAAKMRWKRFLIFNCLGAIAWSFTFGLLGFLLARSVQSVGSYVAKIEIVVVLLFIIGILYIHTHTSRKKKRMY